MLDASYTESLSLLLVPNCPKLYWTTDQLYSEVSAQCDVCPTPTLALHFSHFTEIDEHTDGFQKTTFNFNL